jgi:hypothetical protein
VQSVVFNEGDGAAGLSLGGRCERRGEKFLEPDERLGLVGLRSSRYGAIGKILERLHAKRRYD